MKQSLYLWGFSVVSLVKNYFNCTQPSLKVPQSPLIGHIMRISAQCTSSVSQTRIKVGVYKNDTSVIFLWVGFHICNLAWAAPSMYHPFLILYKATTAYRVMEPELGVVSSRPLCSQLCELSYKDCPTPLMTRTGWLIGFKNHVNYTVKLAISTALSSCIWQESLSSVQELIITHEDPWVCVY